MDTLDEEPVPDKPAKDMDTLVEEPAPDKPAKVTETLVEAPVEDKPAKVSDTLVERPVPKNKPRRWGRAAFIALTIVVLLGIGAGVAYRPVIEWWIHREALARGFELEFADLSIAPDRVVLRQTHVRMVGVPGVDVRIDELVVDLQGVDPLRIQGKSALIDVTGAPDELQQMLLSFSKQHAETVRLPLTLDGDFRYGNRDNPWVVLTGNAKSIGDGDISFTGSFKVQQTPLGSVTLHRSPENKVDLGLGLLLSEKPIVNVVLDATAAPFKVSVSFASQKIDDVCRAFTLSVPKGMSGSTVEGALSFVFDGALPSKPHHGTAAFVVNGWVPPHPRELDGIVFGKSTKVGTTFELLPDMSEVRFTKATVDAGALHLEGKGNAVRDGLSARTKMDLAGNVACSELSASAIGTHMRGFVGDILRGVARMTMGGTVNIRVQIDADTKSLSAAKLDQAVDIGCRLR